MELPRLHKNFENLDNPAQWGEQIPHGNSIQIIPNALWSGFSGRTYLRPVAFIPAA